MSNESHNGGPACLQDMIAKVELINAVLESWNYTQTEALIAIALIVKSNRDYEDATPSAEDLQRFAKTRTRNPVFKALDDLENELGVITRKRGGFGRPNSYDVLPQRIVASVVEQFTEVKRRKINDPGKARTQPPKRGKSRLKCAPVIRSKRRTVEPSVVRSNDTPFVRSDHTPVVRSKRTNASPQSYDESVRHSYGESVRPTTSTTSKEDSKEEEVARAKLPEIEGLNGNTSRFVMLLAEAENKLAPDYNTAHTLILSNVNHYGPDVVSVGFLQWQQALADRSSGRKMKNPFRSIVNYFEKVAEYREKKAPVKREPVGSFAERARARITAEGSQA